MPTETIEGFPLSLQQKRLWSFRNRGAEHDLSSEAEYAIDGPLDRSAFERALRTVIKRHEICRSVYRVVPGLPEPVQILEEQCEIRVAGDGKRWERAPIFDWELKSRNANTHRLTVRFPAVSADYSTLRLFMEDLGKQYEHAVAGSTDESEPMQYLDYTQWQADLQDSSEARNSQQFWRSLECDQDGYLLPLAKAVRTFASGCAERTLNEETIRALDQMAKNEGADAESIICAAWAVFCCRLAEINSGITIAVYSKGRSFAELQTALGPYDRNLPVEINLRAETSGSAAIQIARSAVKMAQQHQEFYSADLLKAESARENGFAFQFVYQAEEPAISAGRLTFGLINARSHAEPFKLKLEFGERSKTFRMHYNSQEISSEYASILADRFELFFHDFVSRPETPRAGLKFAGETERTLVLEQFPRGARVEPQATTVIELFHRESTLHPQRPALICNGQALTYGALNARANQLAQYLLELGVGNGSPVAISAERSFEMIVGLLGIQKAGGAYVPLDPSYPRERLEQVLQDCGAKVLVTQPHLVNQLPVHQCRLVELGSGFNGDALSMRSDENPKCVINPEHAAYIIYTSGSTGKPKGVPISHRQLAYSTAARIQYYNEPIANYLLLSSFAFDSSIAGIFWSLTQGGTLTIPREGSHQDPDHLRALIRDYKVSHLLALPSFYQAILEQSAAAEMTSLTTVIVAGEACSPELVQRHYSKLRAVRLYNEYGPTEGTVWSTVHHCEAKEQDIVPIGKPVPNMSVYILDDERQPVGIGQLGEIYIAGPAVALGYLNRPDLTAEKFVANVFGSGKLYRTGDLGRFRENGVIEFHGRIDEQVKIRGYRIELGEIEHVLARHPDVREAVVIAREDSPGDKRLVAYVVPKDQAHLSIPELRLFAQEKLPGFMAPAQFVTLKTLPLTPNGKIDRKALPAPDEVERGDRDFVAPRNRDEEQLASIWTEVLKLEKVGVEENFFDLGGHSLLAIQVIARVREAFKLDLPMAAFFEAPTIGGMAVAIGRCREAKGTSTMGIRRVARVAATDELLAKLDGSAG